jgi:predicted small lipoprotein YifL
MGILESVRMGAMRSSRLSNAALLLTLAVCGCGRKGDPVPRPTAPAGAPQARMAELRELEVTLPSVDSKGERVKGLDELRVLYLPLGLTRPSAEDVFKRGEVVLARRRPDLPAPGTVLRLKLHALERPAGWLVVVAVRLGGVPGEPSEPLPWLNPGI